MRSVQEIRADLAVYDAGEKDDMTSFASLEAWKAAMPGVIARRNALGRLLVDVPLLLDALEAFGAATVSS